MLSYLLGIVTPFVIVALWMLTGWLLERNGSRTCWCGRSFGVLNHTFNVVDGWRIRAHMVRCPERPPLRK